MVPNHVRYQTALRPGLVFYIYCNRSTAVNTDLYLCDMSGEEKVRLQRGFEERPAAPGQGGQVVLPLGRPGSNDSMVVERAHSTHPGRTWIFRLERNQLPVKKPTILSQ